MINNKDIETYEQTKQMFRVTCRVCGEVVRGTSHDQLLHTYSVHITSTKHKDALEQQSKIEGLKLEEAQDSN